MAVRFTPEFKRNLRALAKKYRHVRSDVCPLIEELQAGNFIGDRIRGTKHVIFKTRLKNSDLEKGKSSGYRLIYLVKSPILIILITIYSKLDQSDITANQIRKIINEFDKPEAEI